MARLFVVAYLVLLHLFVVAMLYIWSASGGSSAEIDVAALAPLMAPSAQARAICISALCPPLPGLLSSMPAASAPHPAPSKPFRGPPISQSFLSERISMPAAFSASMGHDHRLQQYPVWGSAPRASDPQI